MRSWENECIINPDVLVNSTPKNYLLEFEFEFIGHKPVFRFGYFDQEMNQFDGVALKNMTANGGIITRDIITIKVKNDLRRYYSSTVGEISLDHKFK